jgi:uncharacterized protein YqgC (DUF456 family)
MSNLLTSASKLVFLILTITACVGFIIGVLPVDNFMILAVSAYSFFYANKGNPKEDYLGK